MHRSDRDSTRADAPEGLPPYVRTNPNRPVRQNHHDRRDSDVLEGRPGVEPQDVPGQSDAHQRGEDHQGFPQVVQAVLLQVKSYLQVVQKLLRLVKLVMTAGDSTI